MKQGRGTKYGIQISF